MVEIVKFSATGRRKASIARVSIAPGKGTITVNNRPFTNFFKRETDQILIMEPLKVTDNMDKYDISVKVTGGGTTGQAGALRLALARALVMMDAGIKPALKKESLLTRDPRMKERQKPGQKGARKKFQWVKR